MDEIWERAVETALDGQSDHSAVRNLTLDGAVKCVQGRLPRPDLLERFRNLEHLSIASIGVSSLEQFPRLGNLKKLILSDNRIAGGLEFLVLAGLDSLRDLDLSNNRIQFVEDLVPLSQLKLVSLDLYECPVTRVKDYRSRVFGLIKSLKYLDKMDAEENERPESDEEDDDDDDDEEEEEDDDDPGSCEVDCEDRQTRMSNGHSERMGDVVEVDGEEEGEADEEETETETGRQVNGVIHHQANGFRVEHLNEDDEDDEDDDDDEFGEEEIDEEDGEENDDVVEVHEIEDSDDDGDGDDDEIDDDEDDEEEEVDNDEGDFRVPECNGLLTSTDGEIDGHEQGEDDDGEGDGETEEEQGVEDAEEEDEDYEARYLVLPVAQTLEEDDGEDDEEIEDDNVEDEEDDDDAVPVICPPSSSLYKRKRDDDDDEDEEDDDIDVDNESSSGEDDDNGSSADDDEINR